MLLGFEPHDGRWITGVLVGVDDPRVRMVRTSQGFGQKALAATVSRLAESKKSIGRLSRTSAAVNFFPRTFSWSAGK
jgi:hypothetical protein